MFGLGIGLGMGYSEGSQMVRDYHECLRRKALRNPDLLPYVTDRGQLLREAQQNAIEKERELLAAKEQEVKMNQKN